MMCRRSYLDEDEIFWLLYDTNGNEDFNDETNDKFDDNNHMSSENEKDMV